MRGSQLVCLVRRAVDEESYQVSWPLFESSDVIDGTCPGSISRGIYIKMPPQRWQAMRLILSNTMG